VISDPQNMVSTQYQELAQKVLVHAARARRATGPLQPVTGPLF
jgi:hypothetical protein